MKKKIIVTMMTIVLLFSTFASMGANCELQYDNCYICEDYPCVCIDKPVLCDECEEKPCVCEVRTLETHRADAVLALETHFNALDSNDFLPSNWARLREYVDKGKDSINTAESKQAVDEALAAAKENIDEVDVWDNLGREWGFSECERFALSIFVEETTLPQGQGFVVDVKFKNISDVDITISYNMLFSPIIYGWLLYDLVGSPPHPIRPILFEANSFFHNGISMWYMTTRKDANVWELGTGILSPLDILEVGTHELVFNAWFWTFGPQRNVVFNSNTVAITVLDECPCVCEKTALEVHRASAIKELQAHAHYRGENNFTEANWLVIKNRVAIGISGINNSGNKEGVDFFLAREKERIDAVLKKDGISVEFEVALQQFSMTPKGNIESILTSISELESIAYMPPLLSEKYDECFFIYNSLLVFSFSFALGASSFEAIHLSIIESELRLEVIVRLGVTDVTSHGIVVLEIHNKYLSEINTLNTIVNSIYVV